MFYQFYQSGGGSCSLCGAPGVNKSTCPLNPAAKNPLPEKHNAGPLKTAKKQKKIIKKSTDVKPMKEISQAFYEYPLILSRDPDLIFDVMTNIPNHNDHIYFIKKDTKTDKYLPATIGLHTTAGMFYYGKATDLGDFFEDEFVEGPVDMIQYLLQAGYQAIVGYISKDGAECYFNDNKCYDGKIYGEYQREFFTLK